MKKVKMKKAASGMIESTSFGSHLANVILFLIIFLIAFCSVVPMWHVLMSSLSDGRALFGYEGLVLTPVGEINWGGYELVFKDNSIIRSYAVTIFYVVATVGCGLVLNVLGGYVLCRPSKLRGPFLAIMMFSIMFNGGLIPTYIINQHLGLVGNPLAVILPGCTNAMYVVMMMNAFLQIPHETVEAAQIDGAGHISLMFRVMLPQAKGMALVTCVNTAIMAWNDWFSASIYLPRQKDWWPLQLVIKDLVARNQDFLNYANPDYNRYLIQYAVIVIATLPILCLLPFFIKKLEENMVLGAVKG
ncbi:MAG: carbohydrate ABC transporter permease [Faecousia sp.]